MKKALKISLIVGVILVILIIGFILLNSMFEEGVLVNDFDSCSKFGGTIMETYPAKCSFAGQTYVEQISLDKRAKKFFCDRENIAQVDVCGDYIAVTSSLLGGGITYYKTDGTSFSCPVVGPDSMSPECKDIFEKKVAETFNCTKVC